MPLMDSTFLTLCLSLVYFLCSLSSGAQFNLYHRLEATWDDAKDYCLTVNRVLAKVDTMAKQKWIENLSPYVDGNFWIGLKGKTGSNNFEWEDSSVADYSNWAIGFPGHTEGLNCVRMLGANFTWETFNCSEALNFLCEDKNYKDSYTVSEGTKLKGIFFGLGVIGGLLILVCLFLQLPCCRYGVTEKIAQIGFGTKTPDQKSLFT